MTSEDVRMKNDLVVILKNVRTATTLESKITDKKFFKIKRDSSSIRF